MAYLGRSFRSWPCLGSAFPGLASPGVLHDPALGRPFLVWLPLASPMALPGVPRGRPRRPPRPPQALPEASQGTLKAFLQWTRQFCKIVLPSRQNIDFSGLVTTVLAPSWPQLVHVGPCWPQVGLKLAPSWSMVAHVDPRLAQVGSCWPRVGSCWLQVGPSWSQLGPC